MASKSTITRAFELARPTRTHNPSAFFAACRTIPSAASRTTPPYSQTSTTPQNRLSNSRHFSSTPPTPATVVKHNPRTDEDGTEMSITISSRAAKRLKQIVSSPPKKNSLTSSSSSSSSQDSHLRVSVTSGGCHGFQYLMALEPAEKVDPEEDTIFEFDDEGEGESGKKAEVVMDQPSLELLKGSTVDFTTELIGSQFKIVGNPRATSSCGCGTSFDIE